MGGKGGGGGITYGNIEMAGVSDHDALFLIAHVAP